MTLGLTHNCRLFVLLSGLAHVALPNNDDDVWIMEGVNGFLVAADVFGTGHNTTYPSDKETVALQIPFKNGVIPEHTILQKSACQSEKQVVSGVLEYEGFVNEL